MKNNKTVDFHNPFILRKAGMDALIKELGPVGATYFLRQFSKGYGDYTVERDELLKDITLEEITMGASEMDAKLTTMKKE